MSALTLQLPPVLKLTDDQFEQLVAVNQDGSYESINRSQLPGLSELALDLLRRCILMAETDAGEAIRAFRREI